MCFSNVILPELCGLVAICPFKSTHQANGDIRQWLKGRIIQCNDEAPGGCNVNLICVIHNIKKYKNKSCRNYRYDMGVYVERNNEKVIRNGQKELMCSIVTPTPTHAALLHGG
ncbi:uncharacterized protein G2W53_014453 [Senna tora]|uniref:Uncharacterized protein n=1 Tax=Senna tora TaxID=362788 RepID=A0A834WTI9_9FABA|nr:uncharacterized protein G2W53_014453 [Senna tora]